MPQHSKPRSLKRPRATKRPKCKLYVFSEGKNSEPEYLKSFRRIHSNNLVDIKIVEAAGVPLTIVRKAKAKVQELKKAAKKSGDSLDLEFKVWAVFDRDAHPNINAAFDEAHTAGVCIAYSNPCFEIWPYLHLVNHSAPIHRHDLQRNLNKVLPCYNPSRAKTVKADDIDKHYDTAKARAQRLANSHASVGTPMASPYTDFFELTDLIKKNGKQ